MKYSPTTRNNRVCINCGIEKPPEEFGFRKQLGIIYCKGVCRKCAGLRSMAWQKANPERHHEIVKRWRDRNRERLRANQRAYYYRRKATGKDT